MKKEQLTKANISNEIKKEYSWKTAIVHSVVWGAAIAFLIFCVSLLYRELKFEHWFPLLLYALFLVLIGGGTVAFIVLTFVAIFQARRSADKGDYKLILDRLERTEDDHDRFIDDPGCWNRYLIFASFGQYRIPKKTHYFWSNLYAMSDEGIYNTSIEGDMFYIVTDNQKSILAVYNTKFFEYNE